MADGAAGCVWGWLRPSRVDAPDAGQAGRLAKADTAARRRARATIQACTVGASAIYARAIASISTSAPDGSFATSTVERAGGCSPTCFEYTEFIPWKSSRFWRKTVVFTS